MIQKFKYAFKVKDENKVAKSSLHNAMVSYKNTHQTGSTMRGRYILDAIKYLNNVIDKKQCVPMRKYNGGIHRTAQMKEFGYNKSSMKYRQNRDNQSGKTRRELAKESLKYRITQGRWPKKSAIYIRDLLVNLKANAQSKGLDVDKLQIVHFMVNKAPIVHNRTYRAHGRVNAWNRSPCHIEAIAMEKDSGEVPQAPEKMEIEE